MIRKNCEELFTLMAINLDKIKNSLALMMVALFTMLIPLPAMAEGSGLSGVLSNVGGICIVVVAIVGVIVVVKFSTDHLKGNGSIGKVITAVLAIFALIGIIVVLMNVDSLQSIFGGVANKAVKTTGDVANEALG